MKIKIKTDKNLTLVLEKYLLADEDKGFVPAYKFLMKDIETGEVMGKIDLRVGDNENIFYGGHIGYEVYQDYRGERLAARSIKLLMPFADSLGIKQVTITCNPDNIASRKTAQLAGFKFVGNVILPEYNDQYRAGDRVKSRFERQISS